MTKRFARTQFLLQIACLFALLSLAPALEAQIQAPKKASFVLTASQTAYEAGGPAKVAALVTVDPGWHVNSNKPTFEYLIPTVLDLELPAGWPQETVQYPPGELQSFSFEKQPLAVYDGSVVILTNLAVPAGTAEGTYPVRASLRFQACNDSQCLPPVTAESEIQLTV
ncbi:MAG TPA: protein-disulfide reductase DsbD domain-containing protein, partial [Thermoanaerobaculia bacterium]|nr:protein-disulfide reductase DsbD domain-containing protein [Thermoanaerobaculia bacterium]